MKSFIRIHSRRAAFGASAASFFENKVSNHNSWSRLLKTILFIALVLFVIHKDASAQQKINITAATWGTCPDLIITIDPIDLSPYGGMGWLYLYWRPKGTTIWLGAQGLSTDNGIGYPNGLNSNVSTLSPPYVWQLPTTVPAWTAVPAGTPIELVLATFSATSSLYPLAPYYASNIFTLTQTNCNPNPGTFTPYVDPAGAAWNDSCTQVSFTTNAATIAAYSGQLYVYWNSPCSPDISGLGLGDNWQQVGIPCTVSGTTLSFDPMMIKAS